MNLRRREALILAAAGIAAAATGFLLGPLLTRGRDADTALARESFSDLSGRLRSLGEWRGKILVCNFWATWCAPCREEVPLLVDAGHKYASEGVVIVGIAVDNTVKVREFTLKYRVDYPILVAGADGLELMRRLGNGGGGLPYTVFIGREGRIQQAKLGALEADELAGILGRLLAG